MALSELDSFLFKFKHLLHAEKNATLTFNAEAGRAQVTLCVDLGHVLSGPGPHLHHAGNGTSRSRRRERRAEARQLAAAEADQDDKSTEKDNTEEVVSAEKPVEAEEVANATMTVVPTSITNTATENCSSEVIDEFCPDEQYGKKVEDSEDEFIDYFRIVGITPKKPEKQFVKDILETLDSTLKKAKVHEPNDFYRFVKSVKCEGKIKIFIKTKNIPEYFTVIKTLQSKNIEITKMPR